ncbi:MAG: hypothetical protein KDA69_05395 [Planctomycetaceae bacterium]|nr:hypothetical protein [Planctomycetaceae bacterium]MCA9043733.1 hypothetical protein [Planctomycetaceae bacterium]
MYVPQIFNRVSSCLAVALFAGSLCLQVEAGCNCRGSSTVIGAGPVVNDIQVPFAAPAVNMPPAMVNVPLTPPPGTLGRTYQLRSRPVPTDTHPRAGMLDLRVKGATKIIVHDMNEFRIEDRMDGFQDKDDPTLFHFTSEPLLPGLPHIYRVEVHTDSPEGPLVEERYIRLIMGRIVTLNI